MEEEEEVRVSGCRRCSSSWAEGKERASNRIEERLPCEVIGSILSKLDVISFLSLSSTCIYLRSCASASLSFLPSFHLTEIAPTLDILLLPHMVLRSNNPHLSSLKLNCRLLDDSAIRCILKPSLHELCLYDCRCFTGALLLSSLGNTCPHLRFLTITCLGEARGSLGHSFTFSHVQHLLTGCSSLESLCLDFDLSFLARPGLHKSWITAATSTTSKLSVLRLGYLPAGTITEILNVLQEAQPLLRQVQHSMFFSLQKLSLSVDSITDDLVICIFKCLGSLSHLSLQDAPLAQPVGSRDLSNNGLHHVNINRKLKEISLIRSQEFSYSYFQRVNDLGLLLMADACASLESICLGGFCHVTDTGFRAIIHSCSCLLKFKVVNGTRLTDLAFHDITATSLGLTHISLIRCNLLTDYAISKLSFNSLLNVLDLRDCRNLGDGALKALSALPKLQILLLKNNDISDFGLSYVGQGSSCLNSLSLRACNRLTDECISFLFSCMLRNVLQILDLSDIGNITDNGILLLARSGVALKELRMRNCALVGDISVMALASMQKDDIREGSSLQLLDLYGCHGVSGLAFRWFKKPYFPKLRWLGLSGSSNRDMIDALARARPFLYVAHRGEELENEYYEGDNDYTESEEIDELEEWLFQGEEDMEAEVTDDE